MFKKIVIQPCNCNMLLLIYDHGSQQYLNGLWDGIHGGANRGFLELPSKPHFSSNPMLFYKGVVLFLCILMYCDVYCELYVIMVMSG